MRIDEFISGEAVGGLVDVLLLVGPDGSIADANSAALDCYRYSLDEMLGLSLSDIEAPSNDDGGLLVAAQQGVLCEALHRRSDGVWFPAEVRAVRVGSNGEAGFLGVVRDISQRKRNEAALRESEATHSAMIANISDVIGIMGADGFMKYKSPNIEKWFGWRPEDLIGTDGWLTVHPDDLARLQKEFFALLQQDYASVTVEYRYLCKDGTYKPIELTATNLVNDPIISGVLLNYHDITERWQLERLGREFSSIIDVIGNVTEMRDPYTAGHQRRVAELASAIAHEMGMSDTDIDDVRVAALMHDIGKMSVPAELLSRPRLLSPMEFELVQLHPQAGHDIIASAHVIEPIAELVYQHHERCDGSGYPRGLVGEQLLPGAKVLMVADAAEAMMSHRPYRAALGEEAALAEIESGAGTRYDADVANCCLRLFRERGFAFSEA